MTRLMLNVVLSFLSVVTYGFIVVSKIKFVLRVFLLFKALLVLSGTEKGYLSWAAYLCSSEYAGGELGCNDQ